MSACPQCGAANRETARFCDQCGTRLGGGGARGAPGQTYTPAHLVEKVLRTRAALQGERKRVTVLFADIEGSTQIAARAGAERWHEILDGFFESMTGAVHRYEGTVNQYTGDGIMALFGAPVAHEDHAPRACLAALAMRAAMARYVPETRQRFGIELGVRIGMNSGEVVVGKIGDDLRMDYTAQGLTVNLAQRMEGLCAPGGILMTGATAGLVRERFRLRPRGRQRVHGADEPVEIFELEAEAAAVSGLVRWDHTRFIGRRGELAALDGAVRRVHEGGRGEGVVLAGGAGVGKTRLCREFGRHCAAQDVRFFRTVCMPYTRALPLWPVRRLLRDRLGIEDGMTADQIRAIADAALASRREIPATLRQRWSEFLGAGGEEAALQTQGQQGQRRGLRDLMSEILLDAGAMQVLLVEDVHWADAASEQFLQKLAARVPESTTLLLFNVRPEHEPPWLRGAASSRIEIAEFAGDELDQLAVEWLGGDPSLRDVVERVRTRTGGNPFFLEEAVRDLEQAGYIEGAKGAYRLVRPVTEWQIPDTVHALLAARMDRLPPAQKETLHTAAVMGSRFRVDLLAEVSGASITDVHAQLSALAGAGFVRRPARTLGPVFAFCHLLMQEVAYDTQLETRRRETHARLAEVLERRHPTGSAPSEQWVQIAHHWEKAGDWARAGRWNMRAMEWASCWDLNVMLEQVRSAIANLDRAGAGPELTEARIAARAELIRMAMYATVPAEEVERAYVEGKALARNQRDLGGHARLLLSYGVHRLHRGNADKAAELAASAARLVVAADRGDPDLTFTEHVLYTHNMAGRLDEGLSLAGELAGSRWPEGRASARDCAARAEHAVTLTYLGRLRDARRELEAVLEVAEGDDNTRSRVHAFLVEYAAFSGMTDGALEHAQQAMQRAEALGSPQHKAMALRVLGQAHCVLGQHARAITPLEQARSLFVEGTSGHVFQGVYLGTLAESYRGSGHATLAAETAETAVAAARNARARIQELEAWSVFLLLPRDGHWAGRVPFALLRMEELIAETSANAFLPWWCLGQARWAPSPEMREQWLRKAIEEFRQIGAEGHARRLEAQTV